MTDKKAKDSGKSPDAPKLTEQAETKSNFAKAAQGSDGKSGGKTDKVAKPARGGRGWLWLLIAALIVGGGGAWVWFNWPQVQATLARHLDFLPGVGSDSGTAQRAETTVTPTENAQPTAGAPPTQSQTPATTPVQPANGVASEAQRQALTELRGQLSQQRSTIAELQGQLAQLQRSVTAQGNRLGELGNASREDWQLAEADYLLRLANQRLILERDSRAALGLLEEVDNIVRQVDLPDLYGVRQQLARDITALKLVDNIDREGIYLRLRALEEQLLRTDIQPQFDLPTLQAAEQKPSEEDSNASPWKRSWNNFTQFLHDSVRIRDGNIDPVLLSPQSEARFRQSLRLNMEQAELALLREDSTVFKDSLNRARQLLLEYGIENRQREVLARELKDLSEQPIEADLPSLAASQSALRNYIERLHKTDGDLSSVPDNSGNETPQVQFPEPSEPDANDAPGSEPQ
ncbi:uroporphyrinogen-III C-methyltransferase [Microbulbifer hainanensis]|uniref:uroporphyrinogen-III C-methyltransferase n=1 Tax=Microbulbifer hainanensis TaxID=2735675 RepID=UPI001868506D|nr:uroporphyrinogen-III C-methyltransferase [Microbulbifer hainanensis]